VVLFLLNLSGERTPTQGPRDQRPEEDRLMAKLILLAQALLLLLLSGCTGTGFRPSDEGCGPEALRLRMAAASPTACSRTVAFR
jgi:hypothetical protein